MNTVGKIKQIEKILGTEVDGVWGDDDKTALSVLTKPKGKAPQEPQPTVGLQPTQDMQDVTPPTYR
jgi:hypothetical protein